jgi:tRNA1(Val) A37 N6-methylase TrmN6
LGEEVLIDFLDTGMKIVQRNDHFNFSIDTVLLAGFATINAKIKKAVELGSGNGAMLMLLSMRTTADLCGIEILETSHMLAEKNIGINNLGERITLIKGDIREHGKYFEKQEFDLVLSNPPFFKYEGEESAVKENKNLSSARHELNSTLEDIVKAGAEVLNNRGYFAIVHRADRVAGILEAMKRFRIEPKRMVFCYSKKKSDARIVLVEGIKNGVEGLKVLPPVYLHDDNGGYSDVVKKMFRGEIIDWYEN